jgi:nucleoside-diphosphate-sugar epimerase
VFLAFPKARIVHSSTVAVTDGSFYGATKRVAEEYAAYLNEHEKGNIALIRYPFIDSPETMQRVVKANVSAAHSKDKGILLVV